ncbi:hypothetical protein BDV36DRAFT_257928 [Aspergillus pseudocaelatus]|uniref:Kinesin light chain n=1 Tax=Aspergillus pseudocaelatus TaxID=1825620 RepID=A0ABQ6WJ42_9EURO|nr:hypothetical protein BDV36DRAFT_257928 [Aspergillus pseudocaelatus]
MEVLEGRRKALGPEHHKTIHTMFSLSMVYIDEDSSEAEHLLLQILKSQPEGAEKVLSTISLLVIRLRQGREAEAAELEEQLQVVRKEHEGLYY